MSKPIPLQDYKENEKFDELKRGLDSNLYPLPKYIKRKLILNLLIETALSVAIYHYYDQILKIHRLLAPTLLGCSTGMLAQSITQYLKHKLNYNKICKFAVWGSINGCFTVLWLDILFVRFDNMVYRILIDQLVGAPLTQLVFNILNTLWDHGEIHPNTKAVYIKSLKYSYCFWPFFSIASFIFIPTLLLFPANCLANLFWSLVLTRLG